MTYLERFIRRIVREEIAAYDRTQVSAIAGDDRPLAKGGVVRPGGMPIIGEGRYDEAVVPLAGDVLASLVALQNRGDDRDHNFVMFIRAIREDIVALQEPLSHIDSAVRFPKADKDQIILARVRELSVMLGDLIRKVNR